ncbi:MAG: hypothetical protein EOP01_06040 [Propionibacteriaceae bacterium]|nr:MAG: hypothetical protein EOP01_06040 [Propionibacteriaceae bacterium]
MTTTAETLSTARSSNRDGGRLVVQAWLASRGLIALVALVLALTTGRRVTDMVSNWDVQHFGRLAAGGYWADGDGTLMAFFPGFPGLLSLGLSLGVPVAITGVVVSLACSAVAAGALNRLGGPAAAVAWLFAPTAVFTVVPYTESLFCAAAFWAWERARADRWIPAVLLAAVACSVRVSGLFLIGALAVMVLTTPKVSAVDRVRRLALLLVPTAVIAVFATYLHAISGSWTAWYHAQSTGWVRELTWPWQSFRNTIPAVVPGAYADHPWWAAVFRGEMVSMAVGVLVVAWAVVRSVRLLRAGERPLWGEAAWVGVQVLAFSLSYWFFSVNRATLLWFPLWIMLAEWARRRRPTPAGRLTHRTVLVVAFALEVVLMLWWCWLFFTGHWAS